MAARIWRCEPATITARHLRQLVELVMTTGYYQYAALGNRQGLSPAEQTLAGFVRPYLPHTWLMSDEHDNLAGCYVALPLADEWLIDSGDNWPEHTPGMTELGLALEQFTAAQDGDSFILQAFAIRFDCRGRPWPGSGVSHAQALYDHLVREARHLRQHRISLLVWASHPAAIAFYRRQGGQIVRQHDFRHTLLNDLLYEMHLPLDQAPGAL